MFVQFDMGCSNFQLCLQDLEMLKLVADKKVHLENSRLTITCFEETITLLERESMKFVRADFGKSFSTIVE